MFPVSEAVGEAEEADAIQEELAAVAGLLDDALELP